MRCHLRCFKMTAALNFRAFGGKFSENIIHCKCEGKPLVSHQNPQLCKKLEPLKFQKSFTFMLFKKLWFGLCTKQDAQDCKQSKNS